MNQNKEYHSRYRLNFSHRLYKLVRAQVYELGAIQNQVQIESISQVIEVISKLEERGIELLHPSLDSISFRLLIPQLSLDILDFLLP